MERMSPELSASTSAPAGGGGHGFGTMPVFLASISTILGAVLFLRFGYAVGHTGLAGAMAIIVLGHLVTLPTAMALSEIATNRKVEGGGEYYIISRSFGLRIGAAIGVSLFLSQAVSISFYCIAFAESFRPLQPWFESTLGIPFDPRFISLPLTVGMIALMLTKGADLGVAALYVVSAVLTASLLLFFLGSPVEGHAGDLMLTNHVDEPDPFFMVFAICFPAFTGMTAGVGLSGDLKDPSRSIPRGTLLGTGIGLVVYVAVVWKLAASAPADQLAGNQLIMADIALWGPIIPIGLACATLSSAIGSILVAPRTLQAIARDRCFPLGRNNAMLARGVGAANEPRNATLVTGALATAVVAMGNVDFVARLISMFFMVTYGALCSISFLEHFAANPSYRPTFRSRWYLSLVGAVMCFLMMFQMDPLFAVLALTAMVGLYWVSRFAPAGGSNDVVEIFRGVMSQATRHMRIRMQRNRGELSSGKNWRPSIVSVSSRTFQASPAALRLLGWLCERHGFGTYLHYLPGLLDRQTYEQSRELEGRLLEMVRDVPGVFVDTIVSPSYRTALAQTLQVPGVSGMENNTVLLSFSRFDQEEVVSEVVDSALFASVASKNILILRDGPRHFGDRRKIHIWLNWNDGENAALMTILAYILVGHKEWRHAQISVFAA
ncbi:MAG TPA: hypothetical protein VKZ63_15590, partial [Kofleriaceae bacterium]|nr:hypothetical protein [Kofleriaceae bacterium]